MKKNVLAAVLMFTASLTASTVLAQSPNPHLNVAAIQYNQGALPPGLQQYLPKTLGTRFQWVGSGDADVSGYNVWWSDYMDSGGLLVPQVYAYVHAVAASKSWNYESMFLHFNQDYAVPGGAVGPTSWSNMDCFDVWEQTNGSLNQGIGDCAGAINGALIYNGSSYRDVTRPLYATTCSPACQIPNNDDLYLGYAEPFELININLSTPRTGGSAGWQYWNGTSWAALTLASDTTNGLTANGAIQFSPPIGWTPTIVNSSQSKYWVRLSISNTSTAPTLAKVWGDDWLSHANTCNGACDSRGWNPATCQSTLVTMNNGIQYCAVPSATATAQFRYQARATGYWNHNYLFINPADKQGGQLTFVAALIARWAAQRAPGYPGPGNPNAVMLDNVAEHPQPAYPTWNANLTDVPCSPNCSSTDWQTYINALIPAIATGLKSAYPKITAVGGNDSTDIYKSSLDFNLWELGSSSWVIGDYIYGGFTTEFDNWLPANNPTDSKAVIAIWDNQHFNYCLTQQGMQTCHIWDGGNRTPMLVLASYYFGANQNTMLLYNTQGWSYFDTAEFYPFSSITSTLSAPLASDISSNPKTIYVTDASQFTTAGGPEYSSSYVLRIGGQDVLKCTKAGNTFTTTGPIVNSYPVGTKVEFAQVAYWADPNQPTPNASEMWYYANWFPAMWVDIGTPDPNGWNGGARDLTYLTGTASSGLSSCPATGVTCAETWRIDYTNAIILVHTIHDAQITLEQDIDTDGPTINLVDPAKKLDGPYYRLNSDGTTGPAITSIQLKAGEAAILMKNPIGSSGLAITTASLPDGMAGIAYNQTLQANGGTLPYTWSITSGGLPSGLSMDASTGVISGTPSLAGTSTFTIKVTDANAATASAMLGITIQSNATSFTFSPSSPGLNQAVQFTDTSTDNPTSWSWNFGDSASSDNTSTLQNPTHTYATGGSYTVTLTVTLGSVGGGQATQTVTVSSGTGGGTKSGGGSLDWFSLLMLLGFLGYAHWRRKQSPAVI